MKCFNNPNAFQGDSFMTSTKSGIDGFNEFWPVLRMIADGFWGEGGGSDLCGVPHER